MSETTNSDQRDPTRIRYVGDYQIEAEIARGGMGVVFKARQVSLDRPVALKMVLAGEFASEDAVRRFQLEAKAAGQLKHPNIVAIHEVGVHEGRNYYSMDYVRGEDLSRLIARSALAPDRAAKYVRKVALAVQYAHEHGTLHRDLKPQNILIDGSDEPRVTDFGLAKLLNESTSLTSSGSPVGTPGYMSPEQVRGSVSEIGPASDVYSLGAVLYECITGVKPFQGGTALDVFNRTLREDVVPPRTLSPRISRDIESICLRCLEKAPARRYPSALALAEDLDRFLAGQPILARQPSRVRRSLAWARKNPWLFSVVKVLLVSGVLAACCWLWSENRYLTWVQQHPDYVRTTTARYELSAIARWVTLAMAIAVGLVYRFWTVHSWHRSEKNQPPSRTLSWLAASCAVVYLGVYCWMLASWIDAEVWEDLPLSHSRFGPPFFDYIAFLGAIASARLLGAVRQMVNEQDVDVEPILSSDEREQVLRSIRSGDKAGAVRMLRRAQPSNAADAERAVNKMATAIGAVWPSSQQSTREARIK